MITINLTLFIILCILSFLEVLILIGLLFGIMIILVEVYAKKYKGEKCQLKRVE